MKTEGLTAEEATEIIQRGGVVVDRTGDKWPMMPVPAGAPYRVVTPPPDAEPVVTAEELIEYMKEHYPNWDLTISQVEEWFEQLNTKKLKAARAPKPEPQPIRTLAEALACERLRLVDECGGKTGVAKDKGQWSCIEKVLILPYLDGYDKGRRVYDASEKEQAK